jgi:hypothetical protein
VQYKNKSFTFSFKNAHESFYDTWQILLGGTDWQLSDQRDVTIIDKKGNKFSVKEVVIGNTDNKFISNITDIDVTF